MRAFAVLILTIETPWCNFITVRHPIFHRAFNTLSAQKQYVYFHSSLFLAEICMSKNAHSPNKPLPQLYKRRSISQQHHIKHFLHKYFLREISFVFFKSDKMAENPHVRTMFFNFKKNQEKNIYKCLCKKGNNGHLWKGKKIC